ncbi:hypothetical protein diail_1737 [Diaporthe ilicicola]|nr:hypothetical protein diail_1737 [Diaporthe ilicicola]
MLFPTFSLSAAIFAGLTIAQFNGLPTCAQNCASKFFSGGSYGGCGTDPKCICSNQNFLGDVSCCLVGACSADDQASAITFAKQICSANGVDVPDQVTCSSTASGASATATGTSSGSSASATATGSSASSTSTATTAAAAWAPRQTAVLGMELLGGLAAAGMVLL